MLAALESGVSESCSGVEVAAVLAEPLGVAQASSVSPSPLGSSFRVLLRFVASGPCLSTRCSVEFHLFLIALSVLPGSSFAISAQRLPKRSCASKIVLSSSGVQADFLISGFR
jgi:hypothetical protein